MKKAAHAAKTVKNTKAPQKSNVSRGTSIARRKAVTTICLLLVAVLAGGFVTYAWFQNFVDFTGTRVQTGKMLYEFRGYHYGDSALAQDFHYSTENGDNGTTENVTVGPLSEEETLFVNPTSLNSVTAVAPLTTVDAQTVGQSFFVINKLDGSINFDVGLSFSFDGLAATRINEDGSPEEVDATAFANSLWFKVYDESESLVAHLSSAAVPTIENYIETSTASLDPGVLAYEPSVCKPLSQLAVSDKTDYSSFKSLDDSKDYVFIRVVYGWNSEILTEAQAVDMPVRVHLSVAQIGSMAGESDPPASINTNEQFRAALSSYKSGSVLQIRGDVSYTGDLTITRPVTLLITGTLRVQGNLSFIYPDKGDPSSIITSGGGQLIIQRNNGIGGNLKVDLPESSLILKGTNDESSGNADIFVENDFTVRTIVTTTDSADDASGLVIIGSRICQLHSSGDLDVSNTLQPITLSGPARMYVDIRTKVGAISAGYTCTRFKLVNKGFVDQLNLELMRRDSTLTKDLIVEINSEGYWIDEDIRLPSFALPSNTHIVMNPGSGQMIAKTPDYWSSPDKAPGSAFYSDYTGPYADERDDIDRYYRSEFMVQVEHSLKSSYAENETYTFYRIEYDLIDDSMKSELGLSEDSNFSQTLQSIIEYYFDPLNPEQDIGDSVLDIVNLEIVCYGNSVLTQADYAYIRTMKKLKRLIIKDAVSENQTVPANALKGLDSLEYVEMSESDIVWKPGIFSGTDITELWLPASLKKLEQSKTKYSNTYTYSNNDVIGGIRIIHTSTTVVEGFSEQYTETTSANYGFTNYGDVFFNDNDGDAKIYRIKQYIFTPDEGTRDLYRAKFKNKSNSVNVAWNRCVFLEGEFFPHYEGTTFQGFYVLRLNDETNTCEFVTYTGDAAFDVAAAAKSSFQFNFDTITVTKEGQTKVYSITSFDDYALCNRISTAADIVFGDKVTYIGYYSFGTGMNPKDGVMYKSYPQKISTVTIKGDAYIRSCAFRSVSKLKAVDAQKVTTIGGSCFNACVDLVTAKFHRLNTVESTSNFAGCTSLEKLDINVIERTDSNTGFFTGNENAVIEIHASPALYGTSSPESYTGGLSSDVGRTFVPDAYADLYSSEYEYSVVRMGTYTMDTLMRADAEGNVLDASAAPEDLAYYFYTQSDDQKGTVAVLVACMLRNISGDPENNHDLTTIGAFTEASGTTYPIVKIGSAAYRSTSFSGINTLTIADDVTLIGAGAFYSVSHTKYCVTLDLNHTVEAEMYALYKMGHIRLVGNELETIGLYTLSGMTQMLVARLPNLDKMTGASQRLQYKEASAFAGCSKLRVAYVGPSRTVRYLQYQDDTTANSNATHTSVANNNKILSMFFINGKGVDQSVTITNFNRVTYVVGNCDDITNYGSPAADHGRQINGGENFDNIVFSNWYTMEGTLSGVPYSITLPGYMYTINQSGDGTTLTLAAAACDLEQVYGDPSYSSLYITPDALYPVEDPPVIYGYDKPILKAGELKEDNYLYRVTAIGSMSYNYTTLRSAEVRIGSSTTSIGSYAFHSNMNAISLVTTLDLNNVTSLGNYGLSKFSSTVTEVNAPRLKTIGQYGMNNLSDVQTLMLPSIETIGNRAFDKMSKLTELVLGKNFQSFAANPTYGVTMDTEGAVKTLKIIILNDKTVVASPTQVNTSNPRAFGAGAKEIPVGQQVFIEVPSAIYDQYVEKYSSKGWYSTSSSNPGKRVPIANFSSFEASYPDPEQGVTFFWGSTGDGTAKITFVLGDIPETLVFPSTIEDNGKLWTVTAIEATAVKTLPATVKYLSLPDQLENIGFSSTDLPSTIYGFVLSEENEKFQVIDGALYSKGGKALLIFPRSLRVEDAVFHLPQSVEYIAEYAFYGVRSIQTLYITSPVRMDSYAFASSVNLVSIYFESTTASQFTGRNIFDKAEESLKLYVPAESVEAYRSQVWYNYEISNMITANVPPEESGEEDPPDEGA